MLKLQTESQGQLSYYNKSLQNKYISSRGDSNISYMSYQL